MATSTAELVDRMGGDFSVQAVTLGDQRVQYVRGGAGEPVVLVHGFPEDWSPWRRVMVDLARTHTVLAPDLRGVGGSDAPAGGYDAVGLGRDVAGLVDRLGIGPAHLVGHDIGGWVAYTLTRQRPDLVRSVVVMETLLPGIDPPDLPVLDVPLWHIGFHLVQGLPEALVAGRQEIYFRHFLDIGTADPGAVDDEACAHYAAAYGDPARLRAAFEMYRALPQNEAVNRASTHPVDVPMLLVGGEECFGPLMPALAAHLHDHHGWARADAVQIPAARHYLPEERPAEVAALIRRHAAR